MWARSSTPTEAGPAFRVEGLEKTYRGGVHALRGVTLAAARGEVVALVGPNGSGKTTLLRGLAADLRWDRGRVWVLGTALDNRKGRAPKSIGFATQFKALDPEATGHETLTLFHALRGLPPGELRTRVDRVAEDFGLAPFFERRIESYSGGQRRRLHLAIETLHDPDLLLLDEPTGDLDPEGRDLLWRLIDRWRADGRTTVVATHDLDRVARHCDRAVVMAGGSILAAEAPDRLVDDFGRACSVITLAGATRSSGPGPDPASALGVLEGLPGALDLEARDDAVIVWRDAAPGSEPATARLAAAGFSIQAVEIRAPDLASAYFALTGTGGAPVGGPSPSRAAETR